MPHNRSILILPDCVRDATLESAMHRARVLFAVFALLGLLACRHQIEPQSIGSAHMDPDGTIVLLLRAEGPGNVHGDARLVYPPGHKDYRMVLDHAGGLKPGETKPVPPWPDSSR
jgi:hypothetical protein